MRTRGQPARLDTRRRDPDGMVAAAYPVEAERAESPLGQGHARCLRRIGLDGTGDFTGRRAPPDAVGNRARLDEAGARHEQLAALHHFPAGVFVAGRPGTMQRPRRRRGGSLVTTYPAGDMALAVTMLAVVSGRCATRRRRAGGDHWTRRRARAGRPCSSDTRTDARKLNDPRITDAVRVDVTSEKRPERSQRERGRADVDRRRPAPAARALSPGPTRVDKDLAGIGGEHTRRWRGRALRTSGSRARVEPHADGDPIAWSVLPATVEVGRDKIPSTCGGPLVIQYGATDWRHRPGGARRVPCRDAPYWSQDWSARVRIRRGEPAPGGSGAFRAVIRDTCEYDSAFWEPRRPHTERAGAARGGRGALVRGSPRESSTRSSPATDGGDAPTPEAVLTGSRQLWRAGGSRSTATAGQPAVPVHGHAVPAGPTTSLIPGAAALAGAGASFGTDGLPPLVTAIRGAGWKKERQSPGSRADAGGRKRPHGRPAGMEVDSTLP